jgi:hypothetical protein
MMLYTTFWVVANGKKKMIDYCGCETLAKSYGWCSHCSYRLESDLMPDYDSCRCLVVSRQDWVLAPRVLTVYPRLVKE